MQESLAYGELSSDRLPDDLRCRHCGFGIGVISMGSILPGTCASGPLPSGTLSSVLVVQVVPRPTPASQGAS